MGARALPAIEGAIRYTNDDAFWAAVSSHTHRFNLSSDESTRAHEQCDMRLVKQIDAVVGPFLGPQGLEGAWFENLDYYGDGVRQLSFALPEFPIGLLASLRALLTGEHGNFCVLIKFHTQRMERGESLGALALFSDKVLVTEQLYERLATEAA